MAKRNLKKEKAARNEEYAKVYRLDKTDKKRPGTFNNWCRTEGHPPNCQCVYPTRAEIIEASRSRR